MYKLALTREMIEEFVFSEDSLPNDITLASEKALSKDWLLPEEDEAWANL